MHPHYPSVAAGVNRTDDRNEWRFHLDDRSFTRLDPSSPIRVNSISNQVLFASWLPSSTRVIKMAETPARPENDQDLAQL
jgi:hypothetical protein